MSEAAEAPGQRTAPRRVQRRVRRRGMAIDKPKAANMMIASEWVSNAATYEAWETLDTMVHDEPERAWRVVKLMVGYAADYGTLAAIAAGPVESLLDLGNDWVEEISHEAARSVRMRICLRGVYTDLPDDLRESVENEQTDVRSVPQSGLADATDEEIGLMVRWLQNSSSSLANSLFLEMLKDDPEDAWDVVRVLVRLADDDASLREDVYLHAVDAFLSKHFGPFRDRIAELARNSAALRQQFDNPRRVPIDDESAWRDFVASL